MNYREITKPIGLESLCEEISRTCDKAPLYKRCGLRPCHLIVPLDAGNGRTVLLEHMAAMYKGAGVLDFDSGLDDYLEIVLDGTMQQLKESLAAIESAAVFRNDYCGIIGMDISELAPHMGETQVVEFLERSRRICEHACVVFFVHATPSRNEERLLDKLCGNIEHIKRLKVEPYSAENMCELVLKFVEERGVAVRHKAAFCALLKDMMSEFCVTDVKNALAAAEAIVCCADFSGFTPTVDEGALKSVITSWHNKNEVERSKEI